MTFARSRSLVILGATLAALSLAACAQPVSLAVPTSSSTPSATASATPAPAPTRPALAELVLSPSGLGPLVVGAPVPVEDEAVSVVRYDAQACINGSDEVFAGRWEPAYTEEYAFDVVTAELAQAGAIARIVVSEPYVHTAEGIGVGSSLDELRAAYPTIALVEDSITRLYTLGTERGTLAFEVANGDSTPGYWAPEQIDTVVMVTAHAPGESVRAIYATDSNGSCPV